MAKEKKKRSPFQVSSRRRARDRRPDLTRLWRDGTLNEDAAPIERWSRELKHVGPKVEKSRDQTSQRQKGTVIEVNRRTCRLVSDLGEEFSCQLSPSLDLENFSCISVGDRITFAAELGNSGMIMEILPRKNCLSRCGPNDRKHQELILAANVDLVLIVFSFSDPEFDGMMLDRYLVRVLSLGFKPFICLNKKDLSDGEPPEIVYLRQIGYEILGFSVKTGEGMAELKELLKTGVSVLTGPSGVGKSSIIAFFGPQYKLKTGTLTQGRGSHVTSRANSYNVEENIRIIDTPGLREMTLSDFSRSDISIFFTEFSLPEYKCQFRDCKHIFEKGCAIIKAVASGKIPEFRYKSYLSVLQSLVPEF